MKWSLPFPHFLFGLLANSFSGLSLYYRLQKLVLLELCKAVTEVLVILKVRNYALAKYASLILPTWTLYANCENLALFSLVQFLWLTSNLFQDPLFLS